MHRPVARARGRAQGRRARRCPTATGSRSRTSRSCSGPPPRRRRSGAASGITKGDLLRYYVEVSPYILPAVADRPLVMKRFPNGVDGKAFYQQRSREERPPAGVRIETLADSDRSDQRAGREAFHRRLADHAALHDADGGDLAGPVVLARAVAARRGPRGASIWIRPTTRRSRSVLDVARWVRDELTSLGVPGVAEDVGLAAACTSTSRSPPDTSYESGHAVLPDRRDGRRDAAPEGGDGRAHGQGGGRAARSTWTSCRTSSARRWRPPTAPAPATTPASRRR